MNEVEAIGKNKRNQQQGFQYRGIDDMYNDLQPKFAKHKVFITSKVLESTREERSSKNGGILLWTILKVKFTFYAEDGSSVSSITIGEAMDSGDKGANKAMSVALKYCLMQLLLIPTEELKKEDPDSKVHQPVPNPEPIKEEAKPTKQKLSDKAFSEALKRIDAGEGELIGKLAGTYALSSEQQSVLEGRTAALMTQTA